MTEKVSAIEQQLKSLFRLQLIDSRLDNLRNIRGELPIEVSDLEDEIVGLETRSENIDSSIEQTKEMIEERKNKIVESNTFLMKYESQQMHVKNNREYVAISKEMDLQKLEVMACEKRIRELKLEIEQKEDQKKVSLEELEEKNKELADTMRTHFIDDMDEYGVWNNDYEAFIEMRGQRVLDEIRKRLEPKLD